MDRFEILKNPDSIERVPLQLNWLEFYDLIGYEGLIEWMNEYQLKQVFVRRDVLNADTLSDAFIVIESRGLGVETVIMNTKILWILNNLQKEPSTSSLSSVAPIKLEYDASGKLYLWRAEVITRNTPTNTILLFPEWNPEPTDGEFPCIMTFGDCS